jgi:hypothetical protein
MASPSLLGKRVSGPRLVHRASDPLDATRGQSVSPVPGRNGVTVPAWHEARVSRDVQADRPVLIHAQLDGNHTWLAGGRRASVSPY